MAFAKLWVIAYRDLGRNRRRSILSFTAVALGLALLILLNSYIAGVVEDGLQNSIRLQTAHLQVRADTYEMEKQSLRWQDLLEDPESLAAQVGQMSQVQAAAPVLWASAILNTIDDSSGLQLYGIDTASSIYQPIREALVAGEFLQPDDRRGIMIGKRLADSLGLSVGQDVSLSVINADGEADEDVFTLRGLFSTGIVTYDDSAVFMPLPKAQAFTRTQGHASAIVIMLHRQSDADQVAAALHALAPGTVALTWEDLNAMFLQTLETGMSFYVILDLIVIAVVAVIIANTLLMAVFERIREMGILAALGMKGRQIMLMFLLEAAILGLLGIFVGVLLGSVGVAYLANTGIYIGEEIASAAGNVPLGTVLYARFVPGTMVSLSLWTLIIVLLASLYPAWFAARLEPVNSLRAL